MLPQPVPAGWRCCHSSVSLLTAHQMLLFVDQVLSKDSFRIRWCQWRSLPDPECTCGSVVRNCLADLRGEARSSDTLKPQTVFLDACTVICLACFGLPYVSALDRDCVQVTTSGLASLPGPLLAWASARAMRAGRAGQIPQSRCGCTSLRPAPSAGRLSPCPPVTHHALKVQQLSWLLNCNVGLDGIISSKATSAFKLPTGICTIELDRHLSASSSKLPYFKT